MKYFLALVLIVFTTCCQRKPPDNGGLLLQERQSPCFGPAHRSIVVIDAGHGGKDDGCSPQAIIDEKALTLATAKRVQKHLRQFGYKVVMTRTGDIYVPLEERAAIANDIQGDLFVSVHFNCAKNTKAQGIEIYYCESGGKRESLSQVLATSVLDRVIVFTEANSRGVKTADFRVIQETNMPAILVEGGFLSNKEERKRCQDPLYQEALAFGIARGIDEYLKTQSYARNF